MEKAISCSRKYRDMMVPVGEKRVKLPIWSGAFNDEMADFWSGEVTWNESMAKYTTFKVGGVADAIVFPRGRNEFSLLVQGLRRLNVPWVVVGRGSNLVVADEGIRGMVIVLGRNFAAIEMDQKDDASAVVKVQAGCSLAKLVKWSAEQGLTGLEFAAGIPGSVGGAIVMNAGAWQREMKDVLSLVTTMDTKGCFCLTKTAEMNFAYRSWGEVRGKIALEGFFTLKKDSSERIKAKCREYQKLRRKRQPVNMDSGGSFFKNPAQGKVAGQLIEEAGLKGYRVGGAMVSPVHANFIVNTGGATAADIVALMHSVQQRVREKFGISLEPEVKFLGMT